jgi:hypothetical protein
MHLGAVDPNRIVVQLVSRSKDPFHVLDPA